MSDRNKPEPLSGLPPELAELDAELLAMSIEERPSFGPELRTALEAEQEASSDDRVLVGAGPNARILGVAAVGLLVLVTVLVPPARASLAQMSRQALVSIGVVEEPEELRPAFRDAVPLKRPPPPLDPPSIEEFDRPVALDLPTKRSAGIGIVTLPALVDSAGLTHFASERMPPSMARAGVSGVVDVRVRVDTGGIPVHARMLRGSGHGGLDRVALNVAMSLSFEPGHRGETLLTTWREVSIPFVPITSEVRDQTERGIEGPPRPGERAGRTQWTSEMVKSPPPTMDAVRLLGEALGPDLIREELGGVAYLLSGSPPPQETRPIQWRADAQDRLERAIERDMENPMPYLALGRILSGSGSKASAVRLFNTGLRKAYDWPGTPLSVVADLHYEMGVLARDSARAWENHGSVPRAAVADLSCPRLGSTDDVETLELLTAANYLCSSEFTAWVGRTFVLSEREDRYRSEMLEHLQAAVEAEPGHVGANQALLTEEANRDEWSSLRKHATDFRRASGGHPYADLFLGLALQRLDRPSEADLAFDRALARLPSETVDALTDPTPLMSEEELDRLRDVASGWEKSEEVNRFWASRDPLLLTSVNERWTEHLARSVHAFFRFESTKTDDASTWIRYGPPLNIRVLGEGRELRTEFWEYSPLQITFHRSNVASSAVLTGEAREYLNQLGTTLPEWYSYPQVDTDLQVSFGPEGEGLSGLPVRVSIPSSVPFESGRYFRLGVYSLDEQGGVASASVRFIQDRVGEIEIDAFADAPEIVIEVWNPAHRVGSVYRGSRPLGR